MKLITTLLPLAAVAAAFVLPDQELTNQIIEAEKASTSWSGRVSDSKDNILSHIEETFKDVLAFSGNALDNAINAFSDVAKDAKSSFECYSSMTAFDTREWLNSAVANVEEAVHTFDKPHRPHHPPHHDHRKPNKTVYELIAGSEHTTKLAKLIKNFPDLVDKLNGTEANYTIFAPTDKAFEKLHRGHKKPSDELIKKVLTYHISPHFFPAGRILVSHTIPTALDEDALGGEAQRLRVGFSLLKGLNINFFSRIVAINIFGTNGVIHAVDSLLLPPPPALKIIELLPGEFSTFQLGLTKTGLFDAIAAGHHEGGTLFAPNNAAFLRLGPKINAFLFSKFGEKYLKALLKYHVVANETLYSDAFYSAKNIASTVIDKIDTTSLPKGHFHIDLPTLLGEKSLSIDIARYGGLITIKINGFTNVAVQDGLAKDGVIHVVNSVLIPPKTNGGAAYMGEDLTLSDLMERLEPHLNEDEDVIEEL